MFYFGIMIAGGLGALLRYALGRATVNMGWTALPFGTLLANAIGCFLIGYLSALLAQRWNASEQLQVIVLTGFLGGFTTFSAFSLEAIRLFDDVGNIRALLYIVFKVGLCISMCMIGLWMARS